MQPRKNAFLHKKRENHPDKKSVILKSGEVPEIKRRVPEQVEGLSTSALSSTRPA